MESTIECKGNKVTVTTGHLKSVFDRRNWATAADIIAMLQESLLDEQATVARLSNPLVVDLNGDYTWRAGEDQRGIKPVPEADSLTNKGDRDG